jgi:hypothetical protein
VGATRIGRQEIEYPLASVKRDDDLLRLIAEAHRLPVQASTAEDAVELDEADEVHGTYLLGRLSCAFRALPNDDERLEALRMIDERTTRTS